ncbi:MAG: hypothetical protein A2033_07840 [Bacteroidetes bacterium GWA2_31_9]|nr:MAG: hypothetical protein A2033_07840 [Bacteroidetes bacterium GWA2_31_9]
MEELYHKKCLSCSNERYIKSFKYESYGLIKCDNCGLIFMKQIPTKKELDLFYNTYSYVTEQEVSPITIKRYHSLLDEFEKFKKTNRIFDVGCGQGFFLKEAIKRGWKVFGTEFSPAAIEICKNRGIEMKIGKLNPSDFKPNSFDIITSFEVLEHINNPKEEMENIAKLLRFEGLFYCTTPNFNSLVTRYIKNKSYIISYPEHLIYFTKTTLNHLIINAGFKIYKFKSTGFSPTMLFRSSQILNQNSVIVDANLRTNIENNFFLYLVRNLVNKFLTLTNLGLTLKGYYIKKTN